MRSRKAKADELFVRAYEGTERGEFHSAFRLLLAAAKLGDSGAQLNLGFAYDTGIGVKSNRRAALYWYRRAYRNGERAAASNIATVYRSEGNLKKTLLWFQRAAKLGDGDANLEIAKIYIRDKRDWPAAIRHLEKAARAGPRNLTPSGKKEALRLLKRIRSQRVEGR